MKRLLLTLIRFYQRGVSPGLPAACRYEPTCSRYAYTAIERFGAVRGSWLALRRLLRCVPWKPGGYDPVPERAGPGAAAGTGTTAAISGSSGSTGSYEPERRMQ